MVVLSPAKHIISFGKHVPCWFRFCWNMLHCSRSISSSTRHDAMKPPLLSQFQTNLCNYTSRLLKFTSWVAAVRLMFWELKTCCCKGTVKLLMFEKQQGFTSLMEQKFKFTVSSWQCGVSRCLQSVVRPAGVITLPHVSMSTIAPPICCRVQNLSPHVAFACYK